MYSQLVFFVSVMLVLNSLSPGARAMARNHHDLNNLNDMLLQEYNSYVAYEPPAAAVKQPAEPEVVFVEEEQPTYKHSMNSHDLKESIIKALVSKKSNYKKSFMNRNQIWDALYGKRRR